MKAQVSNDGLSVPAKTFNASDKNKLSALGEESGKKAKDRPDDAENIEKAAKLLRKKAQPEVSEPMDVDESENVCSKIKSGEKLDFSEAATVCLEESNIKMQKHQVDNKQDSSTRSNNENSETNKCVNNKEELNNETGRTPNKCGSESVEMDTLNNSAVNLDESRDFTLMLIKTPKSNGDISVMESSPEIFDSVNLNNTSDEFKTASENENENNRLGEESEEDINQKRTQNSGSRFKIKNSMLLKSALNNGFSPLKQHNGLSSASKEKSFVSLDSWITRTSKQSENSAKSAEFSQNSDIIESSQPDVSLSSSKFNKSVSVSSPIMTQFNSSIYCSPRSVVENEPGSGSKPKVARKLILNERESSGADLNEKSKSSAVNNENSYEPLKKSESDDSGKLSSNFNHKLSDNTKVLSPRNQYLGRTALMMNMAIGDDNKVVQTPSSKPVQKEMSVTPSPPRTPQHLNSVGKKWVKRRYVSDAPPTPSILKKSRNDENESRPKGKLVSFSDPPMIEVLEFSASDPQKDTVYGLDIAGLTENTQDDISTQGSIPEMPEVSSTKTCYPNLSLCRDPINGIVPLLVEPKWHSTLNEKFESRNIMTIGCLASLTELQACQLPVGEPRLFRIKNALKEYHRSLQEKRKEAEEQRKYERSKFMCKFLMPAGIDKAIKEKDEPPKQEEKIVTAVSEGPEENDVIASSINIDSGIDDSICETEIVKPVFSVDVVPTSQTDITNGVNDFGVTDVSPSENEISCSLKNNTNQDPEVEESPPSLNSIVKELKSVIQQSKTGKDASVSSHESRTNNSDGMTVAALDNVEKYESLSNKEDIVETTEVVEDSNQISVVSLNKTNEEENSTVKSARSSEAVLKELVANEKIEESQPIFEEKVCDETSTKSGLTQVTIKSRKKRLSRTVIDKDKVSSDNVEESGQGIDSKNSEVVTKSDNKELHPILKIRSDREINLIKMSNNTIKLKTKQLSSTVSDKDKVSRDSVEESGEGKGPEDSEVVMENNDNEIHSVAEIKSDRELDPVEKTEFNDTVRENHIASQEATSQKAILSCSSDKSEINGKDNHEQSDLRPVENTKFELEDDCFDKMLKCEQPSDNISGVASQSPVKESSQNSESIVQASPVPKSGKSNVRSLRKRKAAMDHDMPKSKVLRSTGSKKFNKVPVQESERPASVDDGESNKIESTNSSNIFEKPPEEKKSVLMPLEKDSPLSTTPNNIEIPVECCDETSLIQASTVKSDLNTVASGSNTVESELSGFKKLGNLYTVSTETKKELVKIFFRDEDASAAVSLLKDAVLDRLDVKRELFNYLLNDEELGVKFCVKF
ncbi:unnamed protein product [Bemisia tabaci]|uniref:Uncharacterized protein n=1 Tax=Bemisia tabaci TaxID=7038 RepID=A0A9P0EZV5_BEMTA|nr:unnamed protein product [Bemisia tabaci]